jgi:hypothetical protein
MTPYAAETAVKAGRLRVIVDGISPLLTHNPESMTVVKDAMKGGRVPDAEVEAEAGVYRLPSGDCGIKGESFRGALLNAAGAWKMKRSSARSRIAHVVVEEELIPLQRRDGSTITNYVIDARRAIVQRQGIIRRRPRFDEWSAAFTFQFDPALLPEPKLIVDILQDSGSRIGVGDYRPIKNGWFGRFAVRSYAIFD